MISHDSIFRYDTHSLFGVTVLNETFEYPLLHHITKWAALPLILDYLSYSKILILVFTETPREN